MRCGFVNFAISEKWINYKTNNTKHMRGTGKTTFMRLLSAIAIVGCMSVSMTSCNTEGLITDTSNSLFYSGVSEISPGTNINLNPTYHGSKPTDFSIIEIRRNGMPYETGCFIVDKETGLFSINGSAELPTGIYTIGIACSFDGVRMEFKDAITINMLKPIPEGIYLEPSDITVQLADIHGGTAELPTAQIATDGNRHVEIKKHLIANIYHNGVPANECKDWFDLNPTSGKLSIVAGNKSFEAGVYTFDFKLTTYMVGEADEEGLFSNALRIDVTSAPYGLSYNPTSVLIEKGYSGKSAKPEFKGSSDELVFTLKSVSPSNTIGITVDDATGVIRFPETSAVNDGDQFIVSVTATNKYGAKDFDNIFAFDVTDFIYPISELTYENIDEIITGVAFSNPVSKIVGDEVTFAFDNLPESLSALKIDPATGTVSCAKGAELPVGKHTINIYAKNIKSEIKTSFTINVVANPYKFTYVLWGNNMGLTPIEDYGNQFRIEKGDQPLVVKIAKTDIPAGVPVKFTLTNKTNLSAAPMGAKIDSNTGDITITSSHEKGNNAIRTHVAVITVTVGGNSEAAVTKLIPLFVDQAGFRSGYRVEYTPFAIRVNPKTGGQSTAPVITKEDGGSFSGFTLDYRRNFYYYKFGGPEQHVEGKCATNTFLYAPWNKYFSALNKSVNTVAASPVSYYGDKNGERGTLGLTACYVQPGDLKLIVNPEKFSDDYGYADGCMVGTMQYNLNNVDPVNTGGTEIFPLIIWLDPSYTK